MTNFGPKPWVNPLGKILNFSTFWTCCFYSLERRFFILEYPKRHFPGLYCLKKKSWKNDQFWTKNHGLTRLEKQSISRLFGLVVFIAQKDVFLFQNIIKDIFMAYIAYKKKLEKWPFLDQNHGLTPLEKCQFFDFLDFMILQPRKVFFPSRIS